MGLPMFFPQLIEEKFKNFAEATEELSKIASRDGRYPMGKEASSLYKQWRQQIADGQIELAMLTAFYMGMHFGSAILFATAGDDLRRGRKSIRDAARGHIAVHGTELQKQLRWLEIFECFLEETQTNGLKRTVADKVVAKKFGVKPKTVQRVRLKYLAPPEKKSEKR